LLAKLRLRVLNWPAVDWHSVIIIPIGMTAVVILMAWGSVRRSPVWEVGSFSISGRKRTVLLFAMPAVAIALFLSVISFRQYQNPHIAAGPFSWPAGCPPHQYRSVESIPIECAVEANALPHKFTHEHGFHAAYHGYFTFYRVGNDAIAITCPSTRSGCSVKQIYRNVFQVTTNEADQDWQTRIRRGQH
jgi:hypothetical protein